MATEAEIPRIRHDENDEGFRPLARPGGSSALNFILLLAEKKKPILGFALAFAIAGGIVAFLLPVRYTATVVIIPPQQNNSLSSVFSSQMESLAPIAALAGGGLAMKNPNDMYVAMLKSNVVEDAIVRKFNLMQQYHRRYLSDARKSLERRTLLEGGLKDGMIHISFEDENPQRAAQIATAYVDQLRGLSQHLAISDASQRRQLFEQQLDQTKNDLTNAELAMEAAQKHTGLIQLDSQARALIETGAVLRAQISAKEVQIEGMRTYATGENAAVTQAEQELAGMRTQLAALGGSKGEGGDDMIVPKGQIPAAGLEYLRAMRDVRYYEAKFTIMARQLEIAKLDEARQGAMIQVVDPALEPDKRSSPHRTLIVLFAALAGIIAGILFVLFRAGFRRTNETAARRMKLARIDTGGAWTRPF
jgi:uncharacterized protein involved in exopolysaccharide biosynthesis